MSGYGVTGQSLTPNYDRAREEWLKRQQQQQQAQAAQAAQPAGVSIPEPIVDAGIAAITGGSTGAAVGGGAGSAGASAATQAAFNTPAGLASQAAWNADAMAASGAATGAPATSTLAAAAPYLGAAGVTAAMAPSYYNYGSDLIKGKGGTDSGVKQALLSNPVTAPAVPAMDALGIKIKSGRHQDHVQRSALRDQLASNNFAQRTTALGGTLDPGKVKNPTGTYVPLADGSFYDISEEKSGQAHMVLNPDSEWSAQAQGWAMPIAAILTGTGTVNDKLFKDTTAQLTNAMRSNTGDIEGIRANALTIFEQLGINRQEAIQGIQALGTNGKISQNEVDAYINGINTLFDGKGYTTNSALAEALGKQANVDPGRNPAAMPQGMSLQQPIFMFPQYQGPTKEQIAAQIQASQPKPQIAPPPQQQDLIAPFVDQKSQQFADQIAAARKNGMVLR